MRRVTVVPLAMILFGCIHAEAAGPEIVAVNEAAAQADRILIGEQSNVYVTVHVDQRIWPLPLAPDSARIFSGSLMAELRKLYEQRGGSIRFPNSRDHRFTTNESGTNPDCQDREADVYVVAYYGPRADGTAFIFNYRIERGAMTRAGRFEVDVAAEIRAGRIRGFHQRRTMTQVIYEDLLLSRAPMIVDQLTSESD